MAQPKRIPLPPVTTLDGPQYRGTMPVRGAGKPPKLRWRPGSFVQVGNQLYEIMYCYRVKESPHEWYFSLEERQSVADRPRDMIGVLAEVYGCGQGTPRIVYELFRDHMSAMSYFIDIPLNGNRWTVDNRTLMKRATLVSSGAVETP